MKTFGYYWCFNILEIEKLLDNKNKIARYPTDIVLRVDGTCKIYFRFYFGNYFVLVHARLKT